MFFSCFQEACYFPYIILVQGLAEGRQQLCKLVHRLQDVNLVLLEYLTPQRDITGSHTRGIQPSRSPPTAVAPRSFQRPVKSLKHEANG